MNLPASRQVQGNEVGWLSIVQTMVLSALQKICRAFIFVSIRLK